VHMANIEWVETEGSVASVEPSPTGASRKAVRVGFSYTVDGHWYGGTFISNFDPYVEGQKLTVRYDPKDPSTNDLAKRDNRRRWLTYAAFVVAGLMVLLLRLMGFR
jgi:Protein of unknown function (DUF3592)